MKRTLFIMRTNTLKFLSNVYMENPTTENE